MAHITRRMALQRVLDTLDTYFDIEHGERVVGIYCRQCAYRNHTPVAFVSIEWLVVQLDHAHEHHGLEAVRRPLPQSI